jgi:hypothetical protein
MNFKRPRNIDDNLPSKITRDLGVASRKILQLKAEGFGFTIRLERKQINRPFIQLDLEGAGIRKHVVVGAHTSKYSVDRT